MGGNSIFGRNDGENREQLPSHDWMNRSLSIYVRKFNWLVRSSSRTGLCDVRTELIPVGDPVRRNVVGRRWDQAHRPKTR